MVKLLPNIINKIPSLLISILIIIIFTLLFIMPTKYFIETYDTHTEITRESFKTEKYTKSVFHFVELKKKNMA